MIKVLMEHEAWRDLVPFVDTLIEHVDVRQDELVIRYRGLEPVREAFAVCGVSGMAADWDCFGDWLATPGGLPCLRPLFLEICERDLYAAYLLQQLVFWV